MPPKSRALIERDQSDMVDNEALHITREQASVFAVKREVMKADEAEALRQKAAESDELRDQLAILQQQLTHQSSGLALRDGGIVVEGFQFSPTGLIAPDEIAPDAWLNVGRLLARLEGSLQWLIGDWIVYGEGIQWGDIPALAQELGFSQQTLHDCTYVARNVQFSVRTEKLSFTHHKIVAPLTPEQQAYALDYAAEHNLSAAKFRQWLKDQQGETKALPSPASSDGVVDGSVWRSVWANIERIETDPDLVRMLPADEKRDAIQRLERLLKSLKG